MEKRDASHMKTGLSFKKARTIAFCLVIAVACIGLAFHTGTGTLSAWGWDVVSTICPLGALEAMLAGHRLIPRLIIGAVVMLVIASMLGRAFCSWACPVPRLRSVLMPKSWLAEVKEENSRAAAEALDRWKAGEPAPHRHALDSRHAVLAGALASSAVFGFPVFCLVCPVGLTFGSIVLIWRLVQYNQWSWGIVLFPIVIVLEVVLLKRWCGRICPIGALLSLLASREKALVPEVDQAACLKSSGQGCSACASACPEKIDVSTGLGAQSLRECVRCGSCVDVCPAQAISIKLFSKKSES